MNCKDDAEKFIALEMLNKLMKGVI